MTSVRADIGKQVSTITRPRMLVAMDLVFQEAEVVEIKPEVLIFDRLSFPECVVQINPPLVADNLSGCRLPLESYVTENQLLQSSDTYDIFQKYEAKPQQANRDNPVFDGELPLRCRVETIQLDPTVDMGAFLYPIEIAGLIDLYIYDLSWQLISFWPIEIIQPFTYVDTPFYELDISKNFLLPLRVEKIIGMNYADRHWREEKVVYEKDNLTNAKRGGSQQTEQKPITPRKQNGPAKSANKTKPSFWDLLFAILQPPITLEHIDNLFLPHPLYPYQVPGVEFLLNNEHALLADDMGTGKTVMTIVALKILLQQAKAHHVLILCPPTVLHEWRRHLDEWASELIAFFVRGGQDTRELIWDMSFHIYVTSYDTLARDMESGRLPKDRFDYFDVVITDEAHHIKNSNSRRSRSVKKLKPRVRWALTGTPIQNKLEDLNSIFGFVYPHYLTSYDMYEEKIKQKIDPYFLRRRKKDVLPDLPPKLHQDFWLELDPDQKAIYEQVERNVKAEIQALGDKVTKQHIFAKIQHLKQICNFAPGKLSGPKMEIMKEQVEEILAGENKVIIFSQYVDEGVKKLEEALRSYGTAKIIGGQTDAIRSREIERFKQLPDIPILIASLKSGGEGLNLTEASYVIHFDHWWNPATMWQAEDRVHRSGQTHGVNVYSYWMAGTIDERIYKILEQKGLLIENVIEGLSEEQIDESLTIDDLLGVLGIKRVITPKKPLVDIKMWHSMSLTEIREKLYDITPREFEELVRELMHYLGYTNVRVTGRSGDGGIDVISTRNTANGIERVVAQCKRYKGNVGVGRARDFLGAITTDKTIVKGLLLTTGEFTPECLQVCEKSGVIRAISGLEIAKYVKQFGLKA